MQVSITGRHVELTDPIKDYVHEKLGHLKHSFDHVVDVHVVLSVEKIRQRCEVTIQASGLTIHASHETDDMYASIDGVMDKLSRQLKRYRAKMRKHQSNHNQRKGREIKVSHRILDIQPQHEELTEDHQPTLVDHEFISAQPMSVDEAIMQLELAENQNVLFFTNAETDTLNALYRRRDGTMSWIEPEAH